MLANIIHLGMNMEHLTVCVETYLHIEQINLSNNTLNLNQANEDSVLIQLGACTSPSPQDGA